MRFKKLVSLALSGAMALSTAIYMPSNANEATDAYFNDLKAVNTWEKIQSDTDINVGASLYEKKKTSTYGYTINTKSNYEKKALRGDIAISFVPASKDTPPIPAIHIYYNEKELYINKVKEKNKHIMSGIKIKNFKSESPTGESQRPRKSIY